MNLVQLTEAPDAALPVALLKEQLRLGTGFPDDGVQDALLLGFLRAAVAAIEGRTAKAFLRRRFALTLSAWSRPDRQPLPVAPATALVRAVLQGPTGLEADLPLAALRLEPDSFRPAVVPLGGVLPSIPAGGAARLEFDAGYGTTWSDVPSDLAHGALMLAAHYHEYRNDVALDGGCMPFGVSALIERFRPIRLGAFA